MEKPHPLIYCKTPDSLSYDEACLNVYTRNFPHLVKLYYQYEGCHNCDLLEWAKISPESKTSLTVKTTDKIFFSVDGHNNDSCSQSYVFEEHGVYGWNITNTSCSSVYVIKSPDNPYFPLEVFIGSLLAFIFFNIFLQVTSKSQLFRRLQRRFLSTTPTNDGQETPTGDEDPLVPSELVPAVRQLHQTRVNSLDTFRGITIALMIFVNYGGGKYWFFHHSPWNGLTVADVIFPWFAWIMGVGIALSVRSKLRSGSKRVDIIYGILARATYLVMLGLFFSNLHSNNLTTFRFPGVLQRLGLSYLIVAFLESILMKRQPNFQNLSNEELLNVLSDIFGTLPSDIDDDSEIDIKDLRPSMSSSSYLELTESTASLEETIARFNNYGRWVILQDILDSWAQWITIIIIVGIHTAITFYLSVPGCPKGYLGPGGLHDHYKFPNCTGGAAGYIDRLIFGDKHIYQHPSSVRVYHSDVPFDPEGLLGVLTTSLTVYLGVAAGRIILCSNSTGGRVKRWAIYAIFTGLISGFLCDWSKEDGLIPINKNLWSLSFVFVTASLAFFMLIILYLSVDHYKFLTGNIFSQAGMNSILLYVGHGLTKNSYPFSYSPIDQSSHSDYFFQNILGSLLWLAIAYRLHKKEIFISV